MKEGLSILDSFFYVIGKTLSRERAKHTFLLHRKELRFFVREASVIENVVYNYEKNENFKPDFQYNPKNFWRKSGLSE